MIFKKFIQDLNALINWKYTIIIAILMNIFIPLSCGMTLSNFICVNIMVILGILIIYFRHKSGAPPYGN